MYKIQRKNVGYIDILGGKIEDGETSMGAAIREVKEETGIEVSNLEEVGNVIIEYPDRNYDTKVFVTSYYSGNVNVKFNVDDNHRVINYNKI